MAVLAVLDRLPTRKENLLLFLTGLALLSAPALLIGISPKYQDGINVDWRHGYIPQTVESFGVGLMAVAVFVVLVAEAAPRVQCAAGGGYGLLGGVAALGGPFL